MTEMKYAQASDITYEIRPSDGQVVMHIRNKQTKWEIGSLVLSAEQAQEVADNLMRFSTLLGKKE